METPHVTHDSVAVWEKGGHPAETTRGLEVYVG